METLAEQNQKKLKKLDEKIKKRYRHAYREMHDKFLADKKELTEKDAVMREKLAKGTLTQEQYKTWRKRLENRLKRDTAGLARILGGADQLATDDVNMQIPEFYSEAENYQTYETEQETGIDTNYSLVNKNSITRAMYGEFFADIDFDRNTKWNQRRIQSAITQGIISGESIPKIADRLKPLVGSNEKSAIRNARTWTGAAVTGGRQESAEKSKKAGADIVKWWSATLDLRTRISHRHLDRTHVEVDEKFANGGLYPCDPKLPPAERYNCRCDVIYYPRGFEPDFETQEQNKKFDMSYDDWKKGNDTELKRTGGISKNLHQYPNEMAEKGYVGLSKKESDDFMAKYHNKNIIGRRGANTMDGATTRRINSALRSGQMPSDEKDKAFVNKLDAEIKKNALPADMTLFRGVSLSAFKGTGVFDDFVKKSVPMDNYKKENGTIDFDKWGVAQEKAEAENEKNMLSRGKKLIGSTIGDDGFMQVSASSQRNIFTFSSVNLQIHAKKGTNAYISDYKEESEIILARGTKFKVVNAEVSTVKEANGAQMRILQLICELV